VLRIALFLLLLGYGAAFAQSDVAPDLQNRPPVAAPTERIDVNPITVVRTLSQEIDDYGSGLLTGLMVGERIRSAVLVAVQENRLIVSKNFGCCIASDPKFAEGFNSDLFVALAAMQLIEQGKLSPERDNVAQMLTHQIDAAPLRDLIGKASGKDFRTYIRENLLAQLDAATGSAPTERIPRVMSRLMIALLNGGAFEGGQVLQPQTVEEMEQDHYSVHPAIPGRTYGFAEMRRNGWRALQYDGAWQSSPDAQARLVVAPDAKLAYFIIIEGNAGAQFWRTLDDALFDRVLSSHDPAAFDQPSPPAPTLRDANRAAGIYEASKEPLTAISSLKMRGRWVNVRATSNGGLVLSGAETAVLAPHAGGYWASADGNINAVDRGGRLFLSSGVFSPLRLWKRPEFYASFAGLFVVAIGGAFYDERRRQSAKLVSQRVMMLAAATLAFLLLALLAWLLSPPL